MGFEVRRSWLLSDASSSVGREVKLLCTRSLVALTGLESELEAPECFCCVVFRGDRVAREFDWAHWIGGGGEGAIVVEVKTRSTGSRRGSGLVSCVSFWIFRGSSRPFKCWPTKSLSESLSSSLRGPEMWWFGFVIVAPRCGRP